MHILQHNAEQIFHIIAAAFGDSLLIDSFEGLDCSQLGLDTEELACQWHALARAARSGSLGASNTMEWEKDLLQVSNICAFSG